MNKKIFYRLGTTDKSGMWYDQNGNFHGAMNSPAFSMLKNHSLKMPYCSDTVGYLSAVETIDELLLWFPKEDLKILEPLGFKILKYEATDYKLNKKYNHWLINEDSSILID